MSHVWVSVVMVPFDPAAELAGFTAGSAGAGAVASFTGLCRGESHGRPVRALVLDHFPGFTDAEISRMAQEIADRFEVDALRVVHRAGRVLPGEAIVFVAAASAHRRASFQAVDCLMDYLKTDAPFWKQEESDGGAVWVEPRAQDHRDKARWETK
jgi:molybdopterin synthase catalytic subunit